MLSRNFIRIFFSFASIFFLISLHPLFPFWTFIFVSMFLAALRDFCVCFVGSGISQHEKRSFIIEHAKGSALQQSYQRRLTQVVRFPSFHPLPWETFQVPFCQKRLSGTQFNRLCLRDVLKLFFFGCFSGHRVKQFQPYHRINSRRSPDINECTLWILFVFGLFRFCVVRLLFRMKFIDIINIIWNFDNIFSVCSAFSLALEMFLLRLGCIWLFASLDWVEWVSRVETNKWSKLKKQKKSLKMC